MVGTERVRERERERERERPYRFENNVQLYVFSIYGYFDHKNAESLKCFVVCLFLISKNIQSVIISILKIKLCQSL